MGACATCCGHRLVHDHIALNENPNAFLDLQWRTMGSNGRNNSINERYYCYPCERVLIFQPAKDKNLGFKIVTFRLSTQIRTLLPTSEEGNKSQQHRRSVRLSTKKQHFNKKVEDLTMVRTYVLVTNQNLLSTLRQGVQFTRKILLCIDIIY